MTAGNTIHLVTTPPKLFVVGRTVFDKYELSEYLDYREEDNARRKVMNFGDDYGWYDEPVESIIEAAGRVCYQSWRNPANRTQAEYIQDQIVGHKHGSVLEHGWLNILIADIPRSTQLELVRHGDGTAFSFESTRFTDRHLRFIAPPHIRGDAYELAYFKGEMMVLQDFYNKRLERMKAHYQHMYPDDKTLALKRAKEAARVVLGNAQGSDGLFSVNVRALRWIIEARSDAHADLSIREFAYALYEAALPHVPATLADAELTIIEGIPQVKFAATKV